MTLDKRQDDMLISGCGGDGLTAQERELIALVRSLKRTNRTAKVLVEFAEGGEMRFGLYNLAKRASA